jgi:tetratricopeptide (TPR) repeat protein
MRALIYIFVLACFSILYSCGPKGPSKPKSMLDSLNAVIGEDSTNAPALHQRAKLYLTQKKYAEALKDMARALDVDSTKSPYFVTMADLYLVMNKSGKAKSALEKSVSIDPNNTEAILKLAEIYLYVEDYQKALDYSNQALKVDMHLARGYFTKGMAYLYIGDTVRAKANFNTTVEQDPDYLVAYENLGRISAVHNEPSTEVYFKNALNINPQDVNVRYLLGEYYQRNERFDDAMREYTNITRIMPTNRSAHYNMGYINFVYTLDYNTGIKHFSDAIAADPKYTEAFYMRGLCYEKLGNIPSAEADFKMALQFNANFDKAKEGLKRIGK